MSMLIAADFFKLKKLIANRESTYGDAKYTFYNPT